jgi:hypothetical protein
MIDFQINRATRKMTSDSTIVDANGKKKVLPNTLNRRSPGNRPTPNFSNQGNMALNTTSARKIVNNHRNMKCLQKAVNSTEPDHDTQILALTAA